MLIRNHTNENFKYFSTLRRVTLDISDKLSNVKKVHNSVNQRLKYYLTLQSQVNFNKLIQYFHDWTQCETKY
jgi:hypothetical protein